MLALVAMRTGSRAELIADLALEWLRSRPSGRPYFLWVHWLAPHMPYEPAFPFDRIFDPGYEGDYARSIDYGSISKGEMTYRNPLAPEVLRHAKALYAGEVATADRALGRLLREMALAGDLENTVVLFTSDHGESLDEHGYFFNHGDFVYGPATNVPWIARGLEDGAPGTVRGTPVSLTECLRLLAGAAGIGVTPAGEAAEWYGESGFCRFPHLNDRLHGLLPRDVAQNPDLATDWKERWEPLANRAKQRFVETESWKLVRSPGESEPRLELFDLARDPAERVDVAPEEPGITRELAEKLDRWMREGESAPTHAEDRTIDEETRRQMESIGYLGD